MPLPYARSIAEEHLYMSLHPCECGEDRTTASGHSLGQIDEGITSEHDGVCVGCGKRRQFVFRLPGIAPQHSGRYGGPDPSRIIDAGEWRMIALAYMEEALQEKRRATGHDLGQVRSCLEESLTAYQEMLKFIPPGKEDMPDSAFFTERGRRIRVEEAAVVFNRSFIEAMIDGVRRDIADLG